MRSFLSLRFKCRRSGGKGLQRPSKYVAERLGWPTAKALDVTCQNVECTCREARLDAGNDIDGSRRQARLHQPGTQLIVWDDAENDWSTGNFGDETRAFGTGHALRTGSVIDRARMPLTHQAPRCGRGHITACDAN